MLRTEVRAAQEVVGRGDKADSGTDTSRRLRCMFVPLLVMCSNTLNCIRECHYSRHVRLYLPSSLGVNTILILTHCFSLWQATSEHASASANDIVARCGPTPVHIQAFATYRPRTTDDFTVVTASEDQPGGIHAVVFYISAMAARHGFY